MFATEESGANPYSSRPPTTFPRKYITDQIYTSDLKKNFLRAWYNLKRQLFYRPLTNQEEIYIYKLLLSARLRILSNFLMSVTSF